MQSKLVFMLMVSAVLGAGSIAAVALASWGPPVSPGAGAAGQAVVHVADGEDGNRDKTGTTGGHAQRQGLQPAGNQHVTSLRSLVTERAGFEPAVRLPAHTLSKRAP